MTLSCCLFLVLLVGIDVVNSKQSVKLILVDDAIELISTVRNCGLTMNIGNPNVVTTTGRGGDNKLTIR
jgi:hypothetical protein